MQALIQVLKVNEARTGVSKDSGKPWRMQDAECLLLNDDGSVNQVGVLMLPRDMTTPPAVGTYTGTFSLQSDLKTRKINAVLTGLTAVPRVAAK